MSSVKTPNYTLTEEFTYWHGPHDPVVLPAGSFVRPIEYNWLPKHITESKQFVSFDIQKQVFCYTNRGILPINRKIIRET